MIQISNLIHRAAESPVGSFIGKQKAQDNVVGALASVIFSRGTAFCLFGYGAYSFGQSLRNDHWADVKQDGFTAKAKAIFSNAGIALKFTVSLAGALSCALAAIYTATRKTF